MPLISPDNVEQAVRLALRADIPFAVIREKGADVAFLFADSGAGETVSENIFFAAPWDSQPNVYIPDTLTLAELAQQPQSLRRCYSLLDHISTPYDSYMTTVTALTETLKNNGGKTVISRVIARQCAVDVAAVVVKCFQERRDATCCVFTDSEGYIWVVATPELLMNFDKHNNRITTMSLAGTKPVGSNAPWDVKNKEEHDMVTQYITNCLHGLGATDICVGATHTHNSATVSHLCNIITATVPPGISPQDIAGAMAPTPAVCGLPVPNAKQLIESMEQHKRQMYAGYFGIDTADRYTSWVTLRCAVLHPDGFCLFTGSGITALSTAQDEWDETSIKAQPLLNIIINTISTNTINNVTHVRT